jgi:DNA adenine methylase
MSDTTTNPLVRPYLKWAGGKRQLFPEISKYLPDRLNYTYFEPFAGAAAVLFGLQPCKAVISDINEQLMLTYRILQDSADELIKALRIHAAQNSEDYYYNVRSWDRDISFQQLSDVEKAARLIYLNKTCYNGLYRVNAQGFFNVPYGHNERPVICNELTLKAVHQYLYNNDIQILNKNYSDALLDADEHSFVYFDPPYYSPDNKNFTSYQAGGFNVQDQIRLRDTFTDFSSRNIKCLLSNSDTEFIRELYQDFEIIEVRARRAINSKASGRGHVGELLIKNS